jgi:hypothetical protein
MRLKRQTFVVASAGVGGAWSRRGWHHQEEHRCVSGDQELET